MRWWETSKGKAAIASSAQGGKRAADNTFQVAREADDFEKFGLLDDPDAESSAAGPARAERSRVSARGNPRTLHPNCAVNTSALHDAWQGMELWDRLIAQESWVRRFCGLAPAPQGSPACSCTLRLKGWI